MKVLFLIDTLEGYGAEKSLVQIAINLKLVTPVFVHIYRGDKLKTYLEKHGIQVYSLNLPARSSFNSIIFCLKPIIEMEKPQIIHSTLFQSDMVARMIKRKNPEIILIGSFVSNSYSPRRYKELSFLAKIKLFSTQVRDRLIIERVDYFLSNSNAIKTANSAALRIPPEKIKVIYRGRIIDQNRSDLNLSDALKKKSNLNGKKIFLNVGRLHIAKGQLDLLKAFKRVNEKSPETVLLIAGEGSLRILLEKKIDEMGLQKNVFLLGYRDDVPDLLEMADFFVFPSFYEGLPGALIEAIIAKKPAIVSNIPENLECFPSGGALFFKPGDVNALASKMIEALYCRDWNEKTQISFEYAKQNFDIGLISKQYDEFYKSVIKRK